jgi:hypothetical protein
MDQAIAAATRWIAHSPERAQTTRKLREGGPAAADSPKRAAKYEAREAAKAAIVVATAH